MNQKPIAFARPDLSGRELDYLKDCFEGGELAGDGRYTLRCHEFLENHYGTAVLLTHSCTAALEMAAMLLVEPGDEVIMPSYTFVSTANAFVLRGAVPVFVDIREDTLNLDESLIEAAIGPRTRAIVPVHYAGVGCQMDAIMAVAAKHGLVVVEDDAQGYLAGWGGKRLGTFGALAALSFHQTKNITSGEGGALIINDQSLVDRAHIIREKGTNRTQFRRGKVDKYEWLDIGSSYLPGDLIAALLLAQLEDAERITAKRLALWHRYHEALQPLEQAGILRRPLIPPEAQHNGHIYQVLFDEPRRCNAVRDRLKAEEILAVTHYVPLHSALAGRSLGRVASPMTVTDRTAATLLRLPLHGRLTTDDVDYVVERVTQAAHSLVAEHSGQ